MKHFKSILVLVGCTWLFGGCASIKYQQHFDEGVDFSSYKTYSWHPDGRGSVKGRAPAEIMRVIEDAVDAGLAERRFIYQPKSPDFLIRFYGSIETRADVREVNASYERDPGIGWSIGAGKEGSWGALPPEGEVDSFEEGTLFLDIHSTKDGKLVWRGKALAAIRTDLGEEERTKMVNQAISGLLDRFPPKG